MIINIRASSVARLRAFADRYYLHVFGFVLLVISVVSFFHYYANGLGLAYSDARSHLDIGRRVVESLKPGLAQIGSVWLPLPHLLMSLTIWNDWMWHSGMAGALYNMVSYITVAILVMLYLRELGVGKLGQIIGGLVFALNLNLIYLQSTAMTEPLLMGTMTASAYAFLKWSKTDNILFLVHAAFWAMMASLVRYDGWFLFLLLALLVGIRSWWRQGHKAIEGSMIFFSTLAGFGVFLWFAWNMLIFHDPMYFISGPYSARAQQVVLEKEGKLPTKGDIGYSLYTYTLDTIFNIGIIPIILGLLGSIVFLADKRNTKDAKLASAALLAPFVFNVLALYMGQSVIYLQNINAETWFNVRYGLLSIPAIAIGIGFLFDRGKSYRPAILTILVMVIFFSFTSNDSVVIEDGKTGASQKNVYEVSSWLQDHAAHEKGFVLISASSHDAILFSSGLQMKRFIHEGTGKYWELAGKEPDKWARWIVMRTHDTSDNTAKLMEDNGQLYKYDKIQSFPFADIYELKPEYLPDLITDPLLGKQK